MDTEKTTHDFPQTPDELTEYRGTIDNLDAALVYLLAERFRCTRKIGQLKARLGLPAVDSQRESCQLERLGGLAKKAGLDSDFVEQFLRLIEGEVVRRHVALLEPRAQKPPTGMSQAND